MKRFAIGCLATLGLLVVLIVGLGGFAAWYWHQGNQVAGDGRPVILTVDLRGQILEGPGELSPADLFAGPAPSILDYVRMIDRAAADDRILGLVARVGASAHGWAAAEELRSAIIRFGRTGKTATAHATSFGELSPANEGYFLASAFDGIEVQPGALVGLTGLSISQPSARALLDWIGIEPDVIKRAEFKTAFDPLTEQEISPANREMLNSLLASFERQLVDGIATARALDQGAVRRLIDQGPLTAEEALTAGLIDGLTFYQDSIESLRNEHDAALIALEDWSFERNDDDDDDRAPVVTAAVFTETGIIFQGHGARGNGIASDRLAQDLVDAIDDPGVDAIVLRLDSGGGSAVASETIAHQLQRARSKNIPVIVSMSNVAASGGYWIAQAADRIIAQPMTITGSIGVILGKLSLEQLWTKLGVNWAELSTATHASMWSLNQPFNDTQRARLETLIDAVYGAFKNRVARSRGLDDDAVEALARGRVWTGEQALELGLVDGLGGISVVRGQIRELLELDDDAVIDLIPYPPEPDAFERLEAALSGDFDPLIQIQAWWQNLVRQTVDPGIVSIAPIIIR